MHGREFAHKAVSPKASRDQSTRQRPYRRSLRRTKKHMSGFVPMRRRLLGLA